MPPSRTVPPSGTLTVVVTVTKEKVGNCTVTPECEVVVLVVVVVEQVLAAWLTMPLRVVFVRRRGRFPGR